MCLGLHAQTNWGIYVGFSKLFFIIIFFSIQRAQNTEAISSKIQIHLSHLNKKLNQLNHIKSYIFLIFSVIFLFLSVLE